MHGHLFGAQPALLIVNVVLLGFVRRLDLRRLWVIILDTPSIWSVQIFVLQLHGLMQ